MFHTPTVLYMFLLIGRPKVAKRTMFAMSPQNPDELIVLRFNDFIFWMKFFGIRLARVSYMWNVKVWLHNYKYLFNNFFIGLFLMFSIPNYILNKISKYYHFCSYTYYFSRVRLHTLCMFLTRYKKFIGFFGKKILLYIVVLNVYENIV